MTYIYIDGGSLNNQDEKKRSGYGSFLVTKTEYPEQDKGKVAFKTFEFGRVSNNQAEYRTLLEALNYCINEFIAEPTIYTDSNLVVSQLNGTFKTNDDGLKKLKERAAEDIKLIRAQVCKMERDVIFKVLGH
jgi:ribonuclease HI